VVRRVKGELVQAVGPHMARQLADLEHDEAQLRGVVVQMTEMKAQLPQSDFSKAIADRSEVGPDNAHVVSRRDLQRSARSELEEFQDAHLPIETVEDETEPEVF
jgi:hypothetical protein